jgi:hypothetical protein
MRLITLTLCVAACAAFSLPASADVGLNDWCVNLNGDISTACNGAGSGSAAINLSGFDTTVEPNALGTIVVTITGTGTQYAAVYMDYDVDASTGGGFEDVGSTSGTASATQSYEMADPNASNIFNDFAAAPPLPNTNSVNSAACDPNFPPEYCDVSWALAENLNIDPSLYSGAVVTFTVSKTAPTSGFYLKQTNEVKGDSIYLSDTVSLTPTGVTPPVPEPMSIVLFGTLAAGAVFLRRRPRVNAT